MATPSEYTIMSDAEINTLMTILSVEFIIYLSVIGFLGYNFWRIMIKQRKISLLPLTIFYISAAFICIARAVDCISFLLFYHRTRSMHETGKYYEIGVKADIVATYFNFIMGIFQVASIIELFFVLGQIKEAAKNNLSEPNPPPLIGIAIAYCLAALLSVCSFCAMVFMLARYDHGRQDYQF